MFEPGSLEADFLKIFAILVILLGIVITLNIIF